MRRINEAGRDLIRKFEGLRLTAYKCPAGVWTIGYGHTGDVKKGDVITAHQADAILDVDLDKFERGVVNLLDVDVNDNEFAALVSFAYNLGIGALGRSTLLKLINAGNKPQAATQFMKWTYAAGKVVPGLVRRRAAERELFLRPAAGP